MKNKNLYLIATLLTVFMSSCNNASQNTNNSSTNSQDSLNSSNSSTNTIENSSSSTIIKEDSTSSTVEETINRKDKNITNFLGSDNDVYRINIQTENNVFPYDKETYISSSLNITEQDTSKVLLDNKTLGVKLRGNSTLEAPKKPFRLKFDKKVSLFGLQEAKSYVLLANYYDKSNVRNYLAYLMANKMSNLYFQPSSIFVDVYVNNQYQGLYLLTEQMQTGKGRVDIENIIKDDIPSFMFELDFADRLEGTNNIDYFWFTNPIDNDSRAFAFKYPEYTEYNETQINYLINYLTTAMNAVRQNVNYEDYIDVDSFIDYYLIQELFKNVDVGNTSAFYYLPADGKLTAGPVWDFDIALDVVGDNDPYIYYSQCELWANGEYFTKYLLINKDYSNKIKERYKAIKEEILLQVYDELHTAETYLSKAQARNVVSWMLPGNTETYISSRYAYEYLNLKTIKDHYTYVENELNKRFAVLDKYYM